MARVNRLVSQNRVVVLTLGVETPLGGLQDKCEGLLMINRIGKQEKHILCSAKLGFDFQKKKKKTLALFFCE